MITENQFKELSSLVANKSRVTKIIADFDNRHVPSTIGLCAHNGNLKARDDAQYFFAIEGITTKLNEVALVLLKAELKHIEAEISKYIEAE